MSWVPLLQDPVRRENSLPTGMSIGQRSLSGVDIMCRPRKLSFVLRTNPSVKGFGRRQKIPKGTIEVTPCDLGLCIRYNPCVKIAFDYLGT